MRITGSPSPQSEQDSPVPRERAPSGRSTRSPELNTPPVRRDPALSLFRRQDRTAAAAAAEPGEPSRATPEILDMALDMEEAYGQGGVPDPASALAAFRAAPPMVRVNAIVNDLLPADADDRPGPSRAGGADRPATATDGPSRLDPVERRLCAQLNVDGATLRTVRSALRLEDPKQPAHNVAASIARHLRKPGHNVELARQIGVAPLSVGKMRQALGVNLSWSQTSYTYPDEPDGRAREVNTELAGSLGVRRSVVNAVRHNIGLEDPGLPARAVLDGVTGVLRDYPADDAAGRVMDIDRRTAARMRRSIDYPVIPESETSSTSGV